MDPFEAQSQLFLVSGCLLHRDNILVPGLYLFAEADYATHSTTPADCNAHILCEDHHSLRSPIPFLFSLQNIHVMTDLTVLHAPNALFPTQSTSLGLGFTFQHRSSQFTATPMVTLSTEDLNSPTSSSSDPHSPPAELRPHAPQPQHVVDDTHLSPPTNTFTSRSPRRRPSVGQRPLSAPPTTTRYTNRRGSVDVFEQPVLSPRTPRARGANYTRSPELIKPPPPLCALPLPFVIIPLLSHA